jgi:hypothetical protein
LSSTAPTTYIAFTSATLYVAAPLNTGVPAVTPTPTACTVCLNVVIEGLSEYSAYPSGDAAGSAAALDLALSDLDANPFVAQILGGTNKNCGPVNDAILGVSTCPSAAPTSAGGVGGGATSSTKSIHESISTNYPSVEYQTASVLTVVQNGPVSRAPPAPVEGPMGQPTGGSGGDDGGPSGQPVNDPGAPATTANNIVSNVLGVFGLNSPPSGGPTNSPVIVGGEQVTPVGGTQGGVVVGGSTLAPGAAVTLGNGVVASVVSGGGAVVIGGQTAQIPTPAAAPSPVNVGGQLVTPIANGGGIIVNGQTITAGGATTLAGGTPVSIGPNGIVIVNGQTATVNGGSGGNVPAPAPVTVAGAIVTPIAGGAVIVNGQTLTPGAQTTLPNGQSISVGNGGTVIVNGNTAVLTPAPGAAVTPAPVTVGGIIATPLSGGLVVISGSTYAPGATVTLPNGAIVSIAPGGTQIVVNGATATIQNINNAPSAIPIVFNGETITPFTSGVVIVGGQTLTPGQVVTLSDGHTISVGTSGTVVVDGSSTSLPTIIAATTTGSLKTASKSNSTSTTSSSTSQRSVGGAIASGIGVTKKGDAAALYAGRQEGAINIGFGFALGLISFLAGL